MSCPGDEMGLLGWVLTILGGLLVAMLWLLLLLAHHTPAYDRPTVATHIHLGGNRWMRKPPPPSHH